MINNYLKRCSNIKNIIEFLSVRLSTQASTTSSNNSNPSKKLLLSNLRKKTGFSFQNCSKALKMFENDIIKAEEWLKQEAQKEGWSKAQKLQNRPMSQGLIGIYNNGDCASMIEINCETDFVARNDKFIELVKEISECCYNHAKYLIEGKLTLLSKQEIEHYELRNGETISHNITTAIGNIGENIAIRRVALMHAASESKQYVGYYVHSAGSQKLLKDKCTMGKYGSLVLYSQMKGIKTSNIEKLGSMIGQHVVGMNPKVIGSLEEFEKESLDGTKISSDSEERTQLSDVHEDKLIKQEWLLDPNQTVGSWLIENGIIVNNFMRFECGEEIEVPSENNSLLETFFYF